MAHPSRRSSVGRTLAGRAMSLIRQRILTGEYPPGTHLPIEELAEELDMSTMPVREALQRLNNAGFVDYRPHRGARVTSLSVDDVLDIYSTRLALETLAIKRATRNFKKENEVEARRWLEEYLSHDADDWDAREAQMEFHFALYRAAESPWLNQIIEPLFQHSERYRIHALSADVTAHRRELHEDLLAACVDHDGERAAEHLTAALLQTVHAIEKSAGDEGRFILEHIEIPAYLPVAQTADRD